MCVCFRFSSWSLTSGVEPAGGRRAFGKREGSFQSMWKLPCDVWKTILMFLSFIIFFAALPVVCFPRKDILWLELRYACCPQVFTLLTSAQICWRVICKTHTHTQAWSATAAVSTLWLSQMWMWCSDSPAPGGSPPTGCRCCRWKRRRWCSARESRYFLNCRNRWSHCCGPAVETENSFIWRGSAFACSLLKTKICKTNETFGIIRTCRKSL